MRLQARHLTNKKPGQEDLSRRVVLAGLPVSFPFGRNEEGVRYAREARPRYDLMALSNCFTRSVRSHVKKLSAFLPLPDFSGSLPK